MAAAVLTAACSSKQDAAPQHYAVLRFENLTPDPALNWMGRAASEVLIHEIGAIPSAAIYQANQPFAGRPVTAPGISTEMADALLAGATRVITGYYELVAGKLSFTAVEEDAKSGRTVRSATVQGNVLPACAALARQFAPAPKAYATESETALRDVILAMEMQATGSAGATPQLLENAVAADPKFSEAYLAWSETALAHGDRAAIEHILGEARAHNLNDGTITKLEYVEATINKDPVALKKALTRIVETHPGDVGALKALADSEYNGHHFQEAAAYYAKGASAERADLFNLAAYSRMFGGDEKGALAAIQEFQKLRPRDANAIDSQGDIEFFFGHFGDAEKTYLRAAEKDPAFNQGGETWKAARARLMTGDVAGATQIFERYRDQRAKANDPSIPFRAAEWRFLSGDRAGGIDAMRKVADEASNTGQDKAQYTNLKTLAQAQAAIWELQMGRKQDAIRDADAVLKAGQNPSFIPASFVRFATLDAAPGPELRARAERAFNGPGSAQARLWATGYALFFARRYAEAEAVWKQVYEETGPNEQAPAFLYAGALAESGHAAEAAPLLKGNPLPSVDLSARFESLYFPKLFEWRGDHATYLKLAGNTAAPAK